MEFRPSSYLFLEPLQRCVNTKQTITFNFLKARLFFSMIVDMLSTLILYNSLVFISKSSHLMFNLCRSENYKYFTISIYWKDVYLFNFSSFKMQVFILHMD